MTSASDQPRKHRWWQWGRRTNRDSAPVVTNAESNALPAPRRSVGDSPRWHPLSQASAADTIVKETAVIAQAQPSQGARSQLQPVPLSSAAATPQPNIPPLINAQQITRSFEPGNSLTPPLLPTNISIQRGTFTVISGTPDSGASTLIAVLAGLDAPTSGSLSYNGITVFPPNDAIDIASVMPRSQFLITPISYPASALLRQVLFSSTPTTWENVFSLAQTVGIEKLLDAQVGSLSRPQRILASLVGVLLSSPEIIYGADVLAGLNQEETKFLLKTFTAVAHVLEKTIVITIDSLPEGAEFDQHYLLHAPIPECVPSTSTEIGEITVDTAAEDVRVSTRTHLSGTTIADELQARTDSKIPRKMAPQWELSDETAHILGKAQKILNDLPGPIIDE